MGAKAHFFEVSWRRRNLVLGVVILTVLGGLSVTALPNAVYGSRAFFIFSRENGAFARDISAIDTGPFAKELIEALNLSETPEFNKALSDESSVVSGLIQKATYALLQYGGGFDQEAFAVAHLCHRIALHIDTQNGVAELRVLSDSAPRAQAIAQALQEKYMEALKNDYTFIYSTEALKSKKEGAVLYKKANISYEAVQPAFLGLTLSLTFAGLLTGVFTALVADFVHRKNGKAVLR